MIPSITTRSATNNQISSGSVRRRIERTGRLLDLCTNLRATPCVSTDPGSRTEDEQERSEKRAKMPFVLGVLRDRVG